MNLSSYTEMLFDSWTTPDVCECNMCDKVIHPEYDDSFKSQYNEKLQFCCQDCADKWDEENGWEWDEEYEEEDDAA